MSGDFGAKAFYGCDFPGCDDKFDQTKYALNYIPGDKNQAFCRGHADRLISKGIELLSLTDFHKANKKDGKAKWQKQRDTEQRDFVAMLLKQQTEKKGFSCGDIKKEFESHIMMDAHGAAAKYLLVIDKVWWDIEPKTGVKFPVFCVSFGFLDDEKCLFGVKANVAFEYKITDNKLEFTDHVWGIPASTFPPSYEHTLKQVLEEYFKERFNHTILLLDQLQKRAALPSSNGE